MISGGCILAVWLYANPDQPVALGPNTYIYDSGLDSFMRRDSLNSHDTFYRDSMMESYFDFAMKHHPCLWRDVHVENSNQGGQPVKRLPSDGA